MNTMHYTEQLNNHKNYNVDYTKNRITSLWYTYIKTKNIYTKNELIKIYTPIRNKCIKTVIQKYPSSLSLIGYEDLYSVGTVGLIKSINQCKIEYIERFNQFCYTKVYGTILDTIRSYGTLSRNYILKLKEINKYKNELHNNTKNDNIDCNTTIANKISVNSNQLAELIRVSKFKHGQYIENISTEELENFNVNDNHIKQYDDQTYILKAISTIPIIQQQIIKLYYQDELSIENIASIFKVKQARIYYIKRQALANIREYILHTTKA